MDQVLYLLVAGLKAKHISKVTRYPHNLAERLSKRLDACRIVFLFGRGQG